MNYGLYQIKLKYIIASNASFIQALCETMTKQLSAENLVMLMEWLRLGKKFHIHREFLLYLDITDIAKLCFTSKHYLDKYFRFSCLYYIGINDRLLHHLQMMYVGKKWTPLEMLKEGKIDICVITHTSVKDRIRTLQNMYENSMTLRKIIHYLLTQT